MDGWIKLHRQTIDSRVFVNDGLLKVWIWCLLKANHSQQWVDIKTGRGTTEVKVLPGQFVFGRKTAAKSLKMKPDTVYSRMKKLEKMENINMQNNTHYSIVSIINWDNYQKVNTDDQHLKQHPTNTQTPTNQQPNNTDKNDKNENNENNTISVPLKDGTFFTPDNKYLELLKSTYENINIEMEFNKIVAWCISNPDKQKTNRGSKKFINGWMNRANEKTKPVSSTDISTESWF